MFYINVDQKSLSDRLDAGFYHPTYLALDDVLKNKGAKPLSEYVDGVACGPFGGNAIADELYEKEGIAFIRPVNISSNYLNDSSLVKVSKSMLVGNGLKIYSGENLYFGRVGFPCVALINAETSISPNIIIAHPNKNKADAHYLYTFLSSFFGINQLKRQLKEVAQPTTSTDAVRDLWVFLPDSITQKYIGDKVRQAERLRAWGKVLGCKMDDVIQKYQPLQKTSTALFNYVDSDLLTDMLTATTYKKHYVENQKNLRTLGNCYRLYDLFESVVNGYDEREYFGDGLPYIKVADVRPGFIDLKNSPRIRTSSYQEASPDQKPKLGDLLLTRKGSFGIAAVVMEEFDFLSSSEVFVCKPKIKESMPALAWFLNSDAGNMQFWQFSTGTVMPGINQENLRNIVIPDFSDINMEVFNQYHTNFYLSKKVSEQLTVAAKLLVEGLIEGLVTEAELIAAQQGLEAGDTEADAAILRRLRTDGLDGKGQPLFGDVERVYELLELTKT